MVNQNLYGMARDFREKILADLERERRVLQPEHERWLQEYQSLVRSYGEEDPETQRVGAIYNQKANRLMELDDQIMRLS